MHHIKFQMLSYSHVKLKQVQNITFLSKDKKKTNSYFSPYLNPTDFLTTSLKGVANVLKSFIKCLQKLANFWKLITSFTNFGVGQSQMALAFFSSILIPYTVTI
jgi:DNA-directed RNA polymerase specialized sigma54-like protein